MVRAAITLSMTVGVILTACCGRPMPSAWSYEPSSRAILSQASAQALAVDSSGALGMLVVYDDGGKSRVGYTMSHDGADTFMHVIPVSEPGTAVNAQAESSPTLAKVPTAIYALWEQKSASGMSDLMLARSLSYGHSFEKPVRVNDDSTAFHGYSAVGAAPNGDVYAIWLDGREEGPSSETFAVYIARSTDRGATFEPNHRVGQSACPCCRPRIAFGPNGEIYVAWRKDFPGDIRDTVLSTSQDGGKTFSETRVADDGWRLRGCPHSGPSVIQSGERLYIAWLTEGHEQRPRIQLAWSEDQGSHFHAPISASSDSLDPNHPLLATSEDGRTLLAFQGRAKKTDGSWSPSTVFVEEVSGDQMSVPTPLGNSGGPVSYPHVAVGTGGRAYVVWTQRAEQGNATVLLRGRRAG